MTSRVIRLMLVATVSMFILGFFGVSLWVASLTWAAFGVSEVAFRPGEAFAFRLSFGLLLALSAPAAMVMVWAYWQRRLTSAPIPVFLGCLLVASVSALGGVGFRLLWVRWQFESLAIEGVPTWGHLGYFWWGLLVMLVCCGIWGLFLYAVSLHRLKLDERQE